MFLMRMMLALGALLALVGSAAAEELTPVKRLEDAVQRSTALVERGAANYPQHRQCFSCHHQTLPLLAITAARDQASPSTRRWWLRNWSSPPRFSRTAANRWRAANRPAGGRSPSAMACGHTTSPTRRPATSPTPWWPT